MKTGREVEGFRVGMYALSNVTTMQFVVVEARQCSSAFCPVLIASTCMSTTTQCYRMTYLEADDGACEEVVDPSTLLSG